MKKLIIAGSRSWKDYSTFCQFLANIDFSRIQIVEGGAAGVDEMAKRYAVSHNISFRTFDADWDKHGKAAGPIRNRQMAEYADGLLAFWNGRSRGTENMIKIAEELNLKVRVISI